MIASKLDAASRLGGGRLALLATLAAIVVLDLGLPDLDGREVVAGLRDWFICLILTVSLAKPALPRPRRSAPATPPRGAILVPTASVLIRCRACTPDLIRVVERANPDHDPGLLGPGRSSARVSARSSWSRAAPARPCARGISPAMPSVWSRWVAARSAVVRGLLPDRSHQQAAARELGVPVRSAGCCGRRLKERT
jgi:hypothetical protein